MPAHVEVEKIEVADVATKMALNREVDVNMALGVQECRALIISRITAGWLEQWENKRRGSIILIFRTVLMCSVNSVLKREGQSNLGSGRRHTVMVTGLRLGHCGLAWDLFKALGELVCTHGVQ